MSSSARVVVRHLGRRDYLEVWQQMRHFTDVREPLTYNEMWVVEHPPVFTQGQAGRPEHLLYAGDIPLVQSDRGGQITYHGPGQIVVYLLLSLRQLGLGVRSLVSALENSVIEVLASYGVAARARADAPGVYVGEAKIAALGLRIRRGYSYHGLALNVDMDLGPFQHINPCGYANMPVTQLRALVHDVVLEKVQQELVQTLCKQLDLHDVCDGANS